MTDATPAAKFTPRARWRIWFLLVAGFLIGSLIWLFLLRGSFILYRDATLITGQFVLGMMLLGMLVLLRTTPADAIRLSPRKSIAFVVGGAVLLQLAALFLLMPALSDDVLRYRIDGLTWLMRQTPYATSPTQLMARDDSRIDDIDRMTPFPDVTSLYPPVAESAFTAARTIQNVLRPPAEVPDQSPLEVKGDVFLWRQKLPAIKYFDRAFVFRAFYACIAVAATAILMTILHRERQSIWWACLLAWHPIYFLETAGMGHQDVFGILLVLLMFLALQQRKYIYAILFLALACGVKPYAGLIAPFVLREIYQNGSFKIAARAAAMFAVALACIFSPLLIQEGYKNWLATVKLYTQFYEANGSIYEFYKSFHAPGTPELLLAKARYSKIQLAIVIALAAILWRRRANVATAGYWLNMAMFLLSPITYPWYLHWVLVFIPLMRRGGYAGLTWGATIAISYLLLRQPVWVLPMWASLLEYLPVAMALIVEGIAIKKVASKSDRGHDGTRPGLLMAASFRI